MNKLEIAIRLIREVIPIGFAITGTLFAGAVMLSDLPPAEKAQLAGTSFSVALTAAAGISRSPSDYP
jgi:hypothetical protein